MKPIAYNDSILFLSEIRKSLTKDEIVMPLEEKKALLKRYQDADFWFYKGMRSNPGAENRDMAVYQYKEAISSNPDHYPSMFNLA